MSTDDERGARSEPTRLPARPLRGRALFDALLGAPFTERDGIVDELLGLGPPPDDDPALPRGAVPYVPCGVDAILAAVRDAPVTARDTFVDLGAGAGRAALLVHLLTGARVRGVEIQPALVDLATRTARRLDVADASFTCGDAATTDVDGSVYFIYASFSPSVLRDVLARLRRRKRAFTLCAVGFDVVGHDDWLLPRASSSLELSVYESVEDHRP